MQITEGAIYAPSRADDPPGTIRTRSSTVNLRAGKVSLSTKERQSPPPSCASCPSRNPSRMPCFTQMFTVHRPETFSAARISPLVRASRKRRKTERASVLSSTPPEDASLSISVRSEDIEERVYPSRKSSPVQQQGQSCTRNNVVLKFNQLRHPTFAAQHHRLSSGRELLQYSACPKTQGKSRRQRQRKSRQHSSPPWRL